LGFAAAGALAQAGVVAHADAAAGTDPVSSPHCLEGSSKFVHACVIPTCNHIQSSNLGRHQVLACPLHCHPHSHYFSLDSHCRVPAL
jgi:hypothetical protein